MRPDDADAYYWAGGRKVSLRASEEVVIDLASAAGDLLAEHDRASLGAQGRRLTGSLLLVSKDAATAALGEAEATTAGVHPVFVTDDGSLVAVLPQVRVEAEGPGRLDAVSRSLTSAHVTEQTEERLVVEPDSGRGYDALRLANTLVEQEDTDLAQARLIRLLDRPEPRQRG